MMIFNSSNSPSYLINPFSFFIILFILFNIMNYFLFIYKPLKINKTKKSLKINWKW
uniref:ATP synthase F0 subunit 8 n=1 Tax=Rhynchophorus ferrugineus TaxID=354439 RepID=A0A0S2A3E8_RHYFE|nr:ATP synthase F0 subunit 8 [Rhynchophorus ferrugineus]